jgi:leader peptidase (prepilin peptidase)/N-methyltransferase
MNPEIPITIIATSGLGLLIGSFLNAALYRLRNNKAGIASGRSACPSCGHQLAAQDLIPVLSYLFLRGRCRYCNQKIGLHYPLVELITAASFGLATWQLGVGNLWELSWVLLFTAVLIFLASYDWQYFEIPDAVSLPAVGLALTGSLLPFGLNFIDALIGTIVGGSFFFVLVAASNGRWMGGGDIRLGALLGALLGWQLTLIAIFLAALVGSLAGLLQICQKKKQLKSAVPFGPALALGGYLALLWGHQIWDWYVVNFL